MAKNPGRKKPLKKQIPVTFWNDPTKNLHWSKVCELTGYARRTIDKLVQKGIVKPEPGAPLAGKRFHPDVIPLLKAYRAMGQKKAPRQDRNEGP